MKKLLKRITAVLLVLCMAFSATVLQVSASEVSGAVTSSLSKDLSWFGYTLMVIANTTDDEEFKDSAANINCWLCGGSNISFKLSEISAMCQTLINEVDTLNTQNKEIMSAVQELGLQTEYNAMNTAYQNQVTNVIDKYGFTNAVKAYEDYVEAVSRYKECETEESKMSAEEAKKAFVTAVAGGDLEDAYTNYRVGGVNDLKASVDSCFYNCLADLSALLVSSDTLAGSRFVDKSAQLAYKMYPFSSMQYDFVMNSVKKQLLEITKIMLMYQEFVGLRAEYFKGIDDGSIKISKTYSEAELDEIYSESAENLFSILKVTEDRVLEWVNSKIYITANGCWLYLSEYLTSEDAGPELLTIKNYRNSVDYDFYLKESKYGRVEPSLYINLRINPSKGMANSADMESEIYFNKDAFVVVESGSGHAQIKPFYMLDGDKLSQSQTKCQYFDHKVENYSMLYDLHLPHCDYYNMVQGVYTDGFKNYRCISDEEQLHKLLNSYYYGLCGSSVNKYFASMLQYAEGNNVYFMLNSPTSPSSQGAPTDYTVLPALNSTAQHTFTESWSNSYIDLYNVQSDRNGSANMSDAEYAILLLPEDDSFKGKVEVNADRAEAWVQGADYDAETHLATSGKNAEITVTPYDGFEISALNIRLGSFTKTIDKSELKADDDGTVTLSYSVPYANTLEITAETTPLPLVRDEKGNYMIEDFDDLCHVSYMVNSGTEEFVNGSYVLTEDIDCSGEDFRKREMIGTADIPFNGTFDGQGHTISNLNSGADIEGADAGKTQGLFAILGENATIKRLNLTNASVWSDDSIAKGSAVIAKQNFGTISNCKVTNSLVQLGNSEYLGGIAGVNNGRIEFCGVENTTIVRRWGSCGKRAMGAICEVNNGPVHMCWASNCTFKNGTISDGSTLFAVDNYFVNG